MHLRKIVIVLTLVSWAVSAAVSSAVLMWMIDLPEPSWIAAGLLEDLLFLISRPLWW